MLDKLIDRETLSDIHQALVVAEMYYRDRDARVAGMFPPNKQVRQMRLEGIDAARELIEKIGHRPLMATKRQTAAEMN